MQFFAFNLENFTPDRIYFKQAPPVVPVTNMRYGYLHTKEYIGNFKKLALLILIPPPLFILQETSFWSVEMRRARQYPFESPGPRVSRYLDWNPFVTKFVKRGPMVNALLACHSSALLMNRCWLENWSRIEGGSECLSEAGSSTRTCC